MKKLLPLIVSIFSLLMGALLRVEHWKGGQLLLIAGLIGLIIVVCGYIFIPRTPDGPWS